MEESLLKSDIFFFVATLALVLISIILSVLLLYVLKIVKDITYIVRKLKIEGDEFLADAKELRNSIKTKAGSWMAIIGSWLSFKKRRNSRKRKSEGETPSTY